jgi:L-asparaginase
MARRRIHVGGTVGAEGCVYVKRPEDAEFLDYAREGVNFTISGCRTMGKSSLFVQWRKPLRAEGIYVVDADIAVHVGHQPGPRYAHEWVANLGSRLALHLGGDTERIAHELNQHEPIGVLLEKLFIRLLTMLDPDSTLLVVADEFDVIHELPYRDEIVSAFHAMETSQASDTNLQRAHFCLVGLMPLTDLVSAAMTGKNALLPSGSASPLGPSIQMSDFRDPDAVAAALSPAFPEDYQLRDDAVQTLLSYTGGQPLLTMELASRARKQFVTSATGMREVAEHFISEQTQTRFLLFRQIENYLVHAGDEAISALSTYNGLLSKRPQSVDAQGALVLMLSGLVRCVGTDLEIKGEIFERHFDQSWANRTFSRASARETQFRGTRRSSMKRVCIINTGGTIGMIRRGEDVVPPNANEILAFYGDLDQLADVEFKQPLRPDDSINVSPEDWATIANYIYSRRGDGFSGFVVAHGTDTMAFTASAVAFALGDHLPFPVVFTGAQTTPDVLFGDARTNLYRACLVAQEPIPEVVICFGEYVFRAVRAQKKDDRRFDGFESPTFPPLAVITGEVNLRKELLRIPVTEGKWIVNANFASGVLEVAQFPGLEPAFYQNLPNLKSEDGQPLCQGLIIQTLGAGNVANRPPYSFMPFVERAVREGIPVIITSMYPPDPTSYTIYGPAKAPIKAGAVHAGNMTVAAAVTKFRWVLAQAAEIENAGDKVLKVKELMERNFIGELAI